jgi:hypothetical protein
MSQSASDTDWLNPEPDTDARPVVERPFAGVWRVESQGEDGMPFDTLVEALAEPPMSVEAEIRGAGGCLAQSHPDRAVWMPTRVGAARIEMEIDMDGAA